MLKHKVITLTAATIMGVVSVGLPQFVAQADTTTSDTASPSTTINTSDFETSQSGNTTVNYKAVAPKPWALSVPATINEEKDGTSMGYNFKYGIGKLAIVDAEGNPYEDNSESHTFTVNGTSQNTKADKTDHDSINNCIISLPGYTDTFAWLYSATTEQGVTEPTALNNQLSREPSSIQNITFTSKNTGNSSSPLERYITFASATSNDLNNHLNLGISYSDTISWTATVG